MTYKTLKNLFLFLLANCCTLICVAQEIKSIGVPYVQNYPKSLYLAGNQNWSVAKDKSGVMYFGNTQGLLTYDGRYWEQYEMPNRQIVRAVATDNQGKIYTGAFGEFGYWSYKNRRLSYTSLTKLIPKQYNLKDEIWKIYVHGRKVIFQSFSHLYLYENNKIDVVTGPSAYLFLHKVANRFYLEAIGKGLYELKGSKLIPLQNTGSIQPSGILSILSYRDGKLLIGTSKKGLFVYDGQTYSTLNTAANNFLSTYQLNNGVKLLDKYYAYGTILNGVIIIDENGTIVQQINKSSGLQNNTVLSLYADDEQNLWTGLDNGIDRVELDSRLYFYFDKAGQFGTVYSSLIYQNNIYLGTNQGLFYSAWRPGQSNSLDFKLVPNSQGQVWQLTEIDGQLLCGHNDGTFIISGNKLVPISTIKGGWTIKKLRLRPEYLIQGSYTGLVVFKKNASGSWQFLHKVAGFGEPSRYVEQDARGDIWVSHAYKGLYKLSLSGDLKTVTAIKSYNETHGLPGDYNINLFPVENQLIFSTTKGFMLFDEISNRFASYSTLNKALATFSTSNKIIPAGLRKYWFIKNGKMAIVDLGENGKIVIDSSSFSMLDGRMVQYYENISRIGNKMYLISVDDGFVIYDASDTASKKHEKALPVLIRKVEDVTDTYRVITEIGNSGSNIVIPYKRNNIRISYSLPWYRQSKVHFQYYLEGYSNQWSDWSPASQKDFTNLSHGNYIFKVRARIDEGPAGQVSEFRFTVSPPFYASGWAMLLYIAALVLMLIAGKLMYERKLKKDKKALTDKLQAEKEEFVQKEAEATERQIVQMQTERLQAELASKSRELANSAMSLVYKNELLQKISQEILKLKDNNGVALGEDQLRRIQKVIDEGMNDERDWNLFESSFNEAHESFFKKLKVNHPDLVPNDLKLCAYLRMNMSSKEMASLLNISLRGVEIRRYRLRKKLDVPHDKNLVEFLMEL